MRLYAITFNEANPVSSKLKEYYLALLIASTIFIIVPVIANITQCYFEFKQWNSDILFRNSLLSEWIKKNVKICYFISVICGSSFSAIALCNSYLYQINAFSMGLPMYHQRSFKTKRFFSIVLLEVKYWYI